jgi:hypothetical protein
VAIAVICTTDVDTVVPVTATAETVADPVVGDVGDVGVLLPVHAVVAMRRTKAATFRMRQCVFMLHAGATKMPQLEAQPPTLE